MYASLLMFGLSLVVYLMDLCISWGLIESKASLNKDSFFVDFFPPISLHGESAFGSTPNNL